MKNKILKGLVLTVILVSVFACTPKKEEPVGCCYRQRTN